ncbi:tetratricopeptide repeat protein [Streptomyces sp. B1866]|uniref:tetratricopeptide repeat protein n=1 Tax=Streptomyces sp. B1866 TaxID=3075431 RepID=UPI00288F5F98|nr:tetratricopeptide repeat protein [Streptomyces sp. B1866]MDT3398498.1 tetratricopeptide repeat protein [Streptomyces sp. B1866]
MRKRFGRHVGPVLVMLGAWLSLAVGVVGNMAMGGEVPRFLFPLRPWSWPLLLALAVLSTAAELLLRRWEARPLRGLADLLHAPELKHPSYGGYRRDMLDRVGGVLRDQLDQRLGSGPALPLSLRPAPETVAEPLLRDPGDPHHPPYPRDPHGPGDPRGPGPDGWPSGAIDRVYDREGRSLLILGAPGSGKSTTLYQLAAQLLRRAEEDPEQPIPVVVPLADWGRKRRRGFRRRRDGADEQRPDDLGAWLVWYLRRHYKLRPHVGRSWIAQHRLALLLDGLDEVRPAVRDRCAQYLDEAAGDDASPSMVVTCRVDNYRELAPLHLRGAVVIEPLSREQVELALDRGGASLDGLRAALRDDPDLWRLVDAPLWLQIAQGVYRGAPGDGPAMDGDVAGLRRRLMHAYVTDVLDRRRGISRHHPTVALRWLAQLARLTESAGSASATDLRRTYRRIDPPGPWVMGVSCVLGPLVGAALLVGVALPYARHAGVVPATLAAVFFGFCGVAMPVPSLLAVLGPGHPPDPLALRPCRRAAAIVAGTAVGAAAGLGLARAGSALTGWLLGLSPVWNRVFAAAVVASFGVLVMIVAGGRGRVLAAAATLAAATGVFLNPPARWGVAFGLAHGALACALLMGLVMLISGERTFTNSDTTADDVALPYALAVWVPGTVAISAYAIVSGGSAGWLHLWPLLAAAGTTIAVALPVAVLFLALASLLRPWLLRLMAGWLGVLPWRLTPFLRETARNGLITRTRSGWRFMHAELQEYLAGVDPLDAVHAAEPGPVPAGGRRALIEAVRAVPGVPAYGAGPDGGGPGTGGGPYAGRRPGEVLEAALDVLPGDGPDGDPAVPLAASTDLADLFARAGGRLLILEDPPRPGTPAPGGSGDPGGPGGAGPAAGGPVPPVLGALAAALADRAAADPRAPVPVLLDLATWPDRRVRPLRPRLPAARRHATPVRPVVRWVLAELRRVYGVPEQAASGWLESGGLALLLHGSDRLRGPRRARLKPVLNEYRAACPAVPVALSAGEAAYKSPGPVLTGGLAVRPYADDGRALLDEGRFAEAAAWYRARAAEAAPDGRTALTHRRRLAHALRLSGDAAEAEREYRAALDRALAAFGEADALSLALRGGLGETLRALGRLEEAETELRAAFDGCELALGPDHPDTLAERDRLASVLYARGRLEEYHLLVHGRPEP